MDPQRYHRRLESNAPDDPQQLDIDFGNYEADNVNLFLSSNAAATIEIENSSDGVNYLPVDTIAFPGPGGTSAEVYISNARRYWRVRRNGGVPANLVFDIGGL